MWASAAITGCSLLPGRSKSGSVNSSPPTVAPPRPWCGQRSSPGHPAVVGPRPRSSCRSAEPRGTTHRQPARAGVVRCVHPHVVGECLGLLGLHVGRAVLEPEQVAGWTGWWTWSTCARGPTATTAPRRCRSRCAPGCGSRARRPGGRRSRPGRTGLRPSGPDLGRRPGSGAARAGRLADVRHPLGAAPAIQKIIQVTKPAATMDSTPPTSSWVRKVNCLLWRPNPRVTTMLRSTASPTPSHTRGSRFRRPDLTR